MDIKIPNQFKVHNRTYNLGEDIELTRSNLEGNPSNHALFKYMLKYLMAPMDNKLDKVSNSMKMLLKPEVLERASGYTHDMDIDAEEYEKHIKYAWEELSESVMYSSESALDSEGKEAEKDGEKITIEGGLLYILSQQGWLQSQEKELIDKIIRAMPERGKREPFKEILDTVDDSGKPSIGRIGQQKIMGYRTGERASKLMNAANYKQLFYPVIDLLKTVKVEEKPNEKIGKIDNKKIIEYKHYPKPRQIDGNKILDSSDIIIHFDNAFSALRKEYGMSMKMERLTSDDEIENMLNGEILKYDWNLDESNLLDAEGLPTKQYAIGELNPDEQLTEWKRRNWDYDSEGLSNEEIYYARRINLKLEYDKQLDKGEIEKELLFNLYLYRIISKDKMKQYIDFGKYGDQGFDFTEPEYKVMGKVLEDKENRTGIEQKLHQQYTIHGISKINEREAKRLRGENKSLIQGLPDSQFSDRKLFDNISDPDISKIDLRNAENVGEFREELHKAITPGTEGKLKFSIGIMATKSHGGHVLLSVEFIPKVKGPYADYHAKTFAERGKEKVIPSNLKPSQIKNQPSLAARGGQNLWYEGIPNALMFLYYIKKQLTRLNKMVKPYV